MPGSFGTKAGAWTDADISANCDYWFGRTDSGILGGGLGMGLGFGVDPDVCWNVTSAVYHIS